MTLPKRIIGFMERRRNRKPRPFPQKYYDNAEDCLIYFAQSQEFVKIGMANDADKRITNLQCANPHKIKKLGTMDGNILIEKALHKKFRKHHHRNEWFRLVPEIEQFIGDYCDA